MVLYKKTHHKEKIYITWCKLNKYASSRRGEVVLSFLLAGTGVAEAARQPLLLLQLVSCVTCGCLLFVALIGSLGLFSQQADSIGRAGVWLWARASGALTVIIGVNSVFWFKADFPHWDCFLTVSRNREVVTHPPLHLHPLPPEANLTHVVLKRVDHQVVPAVGAKPLSGLLQVVP